MLQVIFVICRSLSFHNVPESRPLATLDHLSWLDLVVFGAVRTALGRRQLGVEHLPPPDVKLGLRSSKTNVDLAMNQFTVNIRSSLCHLQQNVNSTNNLRLIS